MDPDGISPSVWESPLLGNSRSFEAALIAARARLSQACRTLTRTREDAEDLASETILRALRYQASYDRARPIDAWLYRIAWRMCRAGSVRTAKITDEPERELSDHCLDPAELYERAQISGHVMQAMRALSSTQRRALFLFGIGGLSVSQTAWAMGLSQEATKSLLKRARASVRRQLRREEPTPPRTRSLIAAGPISS